MKLDPVIGSLLPRCSFCQEPVKLREGKKSGDLWVPCCANERECRKRAAKVTKS